MCVIRIASNPTFVYSCNRLDEFASTPSGQLTVSDFRELWLEDAADPPAFTKSRKKTHWELGEDEEEEDEVNQEIIRRGQRTSKIDLHTVKEGEDEETTAEHVVPVAGKRNREADDEGDEEEEAAAATAKIAGEGEEEEDEEEEGEGDEEEEEELEEEMEAAMHNPLIMQEEARLDGRFLTLTLLSCITRVANIRVFDQLVLFFHVLIAEDEARKLIPYEPLDDVDDDEIDSIILNDEEVKIKTQVWMEFNKEYLQEQEEKRARIEMEKKMGIYHNKKGVSSGTCCRKLFVDMNEVKERNDTLTRIRSFSTLCYRYIAQEGEAQCSGSRFVNGS